MDNTTKQLAGGPRRLHVIGNAHIDPVWIWDWREGMHEVLQTFGSALQRLDETPDLVFTASSAALYQWVELTDPELFEQIAAAVRRGRWIVTGGQWIEPDCNLPNGESTCRQFLYGQRYFAARFGATAAVGYNIDAFGHNASLPQLLARSGLRAYVMMRPEPAEKVLPSSLFLWEGVDGTRVPTYRIPFGYATGGDAEEEVLRTRAAELLAWSRRDDVPLMLFFGVGDHGGGPTKLAIRTVNEIIEREPGDVGFSSPDAYFRSLDGTRAVVAGELQWHAVGCFSAHSGVKRANAVAERELITAETLAALCRRLTGRELDLQTRLGEAWRGALFVQFHDSLAGTCAAPVYEDLERFSGHATAIADMVTTQAAHAIAQRIDTTLPDTPEESPVPFVVFNPLSWPVTAAVTVSPPATSVTDDTGKVIDTQPLASGEVTHHETRALFQVEVPAAGYRTFWLHRAPRVRDAVHAFDAHATTNGIDNGMLSVRFDGVHGVRRLLDRRGSRDWLDAEGLRPVVLDDGSDTWSHGVDRYDAPEHPCRLTAVEIVEHGPVRATARMQYEWQHSTIVQHVSLYAGRPFVELRYAVEWHETGTVLKIVVPIRVDDPSSAAGVPYGHVDRPVTGHEEVMQRWVDVSGEVAPGVTGGLACTTDWKYAYDVAGARLRVTALRSPRFADHGGGWAGDDTLAYPVTDQGRQSFSLRLHPHRGTWVDALAPRLAEEHLLRLPVVLDTWHDGPLARSDSLVRIEHGTVDVAAVKRAEAGGATVVRVWETAGHSTSAALALPVCDRTWSGVFGPHEVKTVAFPDDPAVPAVEIDIPELEWDRQWTATAPER